MPPLDPYHLTPAISLNRARAIDLPGVALDDGARGKTGYELLSARALAGAIRDQIEALALDPALDDEARRRAFDACFSSASAGARAAAEQIARRMGRNLGALLLALRRGDPASRSARADWDDSYWDHWATIRQAILGGGLPSGELGPRFCRYALEVCAEAGDDDVAIWLSPYGRELPLVGAARLAPADAPRALVFDFGQSAVKRGLAHYEDGALRALQMLPAWETYWDEAEWATGDPDRLAERLLNWMVEVILDARATVPRAPGRVPPTPVLASIAAYVRDGQPFLTQNGLYYELTRITDNAARTLADRLRARTGAASDVRLIHDGTAAAAGHAGEPDSAVITIGTALGIGFPPPATGLRPVGGDFQITPP
jgi:hypothetical protein